MAQRLRSEEDIRKRKKRCADVELIFANWKQNKGFRLRGNDKVSIEKGLISMAHNLQNMTKTQNQPVKEDKAAKGPVSTELFPKFLSPDNFCPP